MGAFVVRRNTKLPPEPFGLSRVIHSSFKHLDGKCIRLFTWSRVGLHVAHAKRTGFIRLRCSVEACHRWPRADHLSACAAAPRCFACSVDGSLELVAPSRDLSRRLRGPTRPVDRIRADRICPGLVAASVPVPLAGARHSRRCLHRPFKAGVHGPD